MSYKSAYQPLQVLTPSGWQAYDELVNDEAADED